MRVTATDRVGPIIERVRQVRPGVLTITIGTGCCESTAPFLYEDFLPGPDQEVVGEIAGVAVYAPEYLRANYPGDDGVVVDVLENQMAESLSIETEFDCRFILRGLGVDLGAGRGEAPNVCAVPAETVPSIATGGPSRVVGEMPEALRKMRFR